MVDYQVFELGDVRLSTGQTLRAAKLAYKDVRDAERGQDQLTELLAT